MCATARPESDCVFWRCEEQVYGTRVEHEGHGPARQAQRERIPILQQNVKTVFATEERHVPLEGIVATDLRTASVNVRCPLCPDPHRVAKDRPARDLWCISWYMPSVQEVVEHDYYGEREGYNGDARENVLLFDVKSS